MSKSPTALESSVGLSYIIHFSVPLAAADTIRHPTPLKLPTGPRAQTTTLTTCPRTNKDQMVLYHVK